MPNPTPNKLSISPYEEITNIMQEFGGPYFEPGGYERVSNLLAIWSDKVGYRPGTAQVFLDRIIEESLFKDFESEMRSSY